MSIAARFSLPYSAIASLNRTLNHFGSTMQREERRRHEQHEA
ncbi:MAG: hypothetical protein LC641_11200 [Spirochaeta sp.]|nr:hypothetical protein [Spirochaeta sp.]